MNLHGPWLQERGRLLKEERVQTIDLIKGVDVILMIAFNYSITLSYFRLLYLPSNLLYWFIFPRAIAFFFIFLSGVVAYISFKRHEEKFSKRYFMRGLKLLIFAASVTFFTYMFVPEGTVFFGILHFFAFSSFLVPFIVKYNKLNLISGLLIILFGYYLRLAEFDFSYLLWLGFTPKNFFTFDYFPLIPWLGVLMLGVYSGKHIVEKTKAPVKLNGKLVGVFTFLGRNSLITYLIHQPVLVLVLLGFRLI